MAIRLKDIARDLGVSVVTVSKVLRGNSDIGEATRRRVLKRMKELNYQPNMMARGLASGRTYTVGLIVPDLVHPVLRRVRKEPLRRPCATAAAPSSSHRRRRTPRSSARRFAPSSAAASMCSSLRPARPTCATFYELGDERTPYLLFDRNFPHLAAHFHRFGRRCGRRNGNPPPHRDRSQAHRPHRRQEHQPVVRPAPRLPRCPRPPPVSPRRRTTSSIRERMEESGDAVGFLAMGELLKLNPLPDAVFCYNDLTAIGAIEATLGCRAPRPRGHRLHRLRQSPLRSLPPYSAQLHRPRHHPARPSCRRIRSGAVREPRAGAQHPSRALSPHRSRVHPRQSRFRRGPDGGAPLLNSSPAGRLLFTSV